jgi:hypothetical protein
VPLVIRGSTDRVPGGEFWKAKHPETGYLFRELNFKTLLKKAREYSKKNNFPVGLDFEKQVESWVCVQQPGQCEEEGTAKRPRPHNITMGDVLRGSRVMLEFLRTGRTLVPRAEAERRAKICAGCKNNQPFKTSCGGLCAELRNVVQTIVGSGGTSFDDNLHACVCCHCFTVASVHLPLDVQCVGVTDSIKACLKDATWCWKTCP